VVVAQAIALRTRVEYADEHPAPKGACTIELSAFVDPSFFAVPTLPPKITAAVDEDGKSLIEGFDPTAVSVPPARPAAMSMMLLPRTYLWSCPASLGLPPRDKSIGLLKGSIQFTAAKSVTRVEVDDITNVGPWTCESDALAMKFESPRSTFGNWSIMAGLNRRQISDDDWKIAVQQFQMCLRTLELVDESDHSLHWLAATKQELSDKSCRWSITFGRSLSRPGPTTRAAPDVGPPVKLRWKFVDSTTTFDLPFEFKGLATP
jgi:hypothetical protein